MKPRKEKPKTFNGHNEPHTLMTLVEVAHYLCVTPPVAKDLLHLHRLGVQVPGELRTRYRWREVQPLKNKITAPR